jgi:acetyl esterase
MATTTTPTLATPDKVLSTDNRADPRIVALLTPFGCAGRMPNPLVDAATSTLEELYEHCRKSELGIQMVVKYMQPQELEKDKVTVSTVVIQGVDNNDITLYIHAPVDRDVSHKVPAVLHLHGGGMAILKASDINHSNWRNMIASRGLVCVGVEFRNSGGALGPHPFPAGLNDCYAALEWLNSQKDTLGISKIVIAGESGGANLSLATSIKCKREGALQLVDGVFVQCPFVSGMYGCSTEEKQARFPSLVEFDGYVLTNKGLAVSAAVYTPEDREAFRNNALAWPLVATTDDLQGLPPHIVVVNELDPLRDEGLEYFRKLLAAGVSANSFTLNGSTHGSEITYVNVIPNISRSVLDQMKAFAHSL